MGVNKACLDARKDEKLSQDNMFATILGMLDIQTEARDPALDLTAACRG